MKQLRIMNIVDITHSCILQFFLQSSCIEPYRKFEYNGFMHGITCNWVKHMVSCIELHRRIMKSDMERQHGIMELKMDSSNNFSAFKRCFEMFSFDISQISLLLAFIPQVFELHISLPFETLEIAHQYDKSLQHHSALFKKYLKH